MYVFLMNPLFWVGLAIVSLVGCTTQPQVREVVVTKTNVELRLPPDILLKDCPVEKPPLPKDYVTKPASEKEAMLTEYGVKQTLNLGKCNDDKAGLRQWKDEQLKLKDKK